MAKIDIKRAVLLGGIAVLFFLLGGVIAYLSFFSNKETDLLINQTFRNPTGPPSIKGPSGPPPMPKDSFPLDIDL